MNPNDAENLLASVEKEKCRRDFLYWLFTYAYTRNPKSESNPVALFPSLPYVKHIISLVQANKTVRIAKSRQIMVSWIFSAYALWYSQFYSHRLVLLLSMTESDATELIDRVRFVYDHQPSWLKELCPIEKPWRDQAMSSAKFSNGSEISSIPSGPHKIRGKTPSLVIVDEAAFQERWEETHTAVLPAISGGGKLIIISTAGSGFFETQIAEDREIDDDKGEELAKGIFLRRTKSGVPILHIFYWADTLKDPSTEAGKLWEDREAANYAGGRNSPAWRREMLIDFRAGIGELVLPWFTKREPQISFEPSEFTDKMLKESTLYGGLDWGMRNLTAFVVIAQDRQNRFWKVYEWGANQTNAYDVARAIKNCGFYHRLQWIAADPSMWNRNQHSASRNGQFTSHADIFLRELPPELRLNKLMKAHEKNDMRFVASLQLRWSLEQPTYRIGKWCARSINEYRNLKYATSHTQASGPEKILDKDNHFFDADKYCLMSNPTYIQLEEKPVIGTIGHLMDMEKMAREIAANTGADFDEVFRNIYEV